jgi:hypothetical protein
MNRKHILAAVLSLAAAACSTAPAPESTPAAAMTTTTTSSAAVNPVGRFEFTTSVQGQMITGAVEIAGAPGAYTGQITTSITQPLPISGVTVDGQQMVVLGNTPDGTLTFRMNFTDATNFSGAWELSGDSGQVTGRRVS